MAEPLPLAEAAVRLRGRPGRPRKVRPVSEEGTERAQSTQKTRMNSGENARPQDVESGWPRLLTLPLASRYTSLSASSVLALEEAGTLRRVQVVVRGRVIRKRLYDRADLDRLAEGWKA